MSRLQLGVASLVLGFSALCVGKAQAQWNGYAGGWWGGLPYSVYSLDSVPYYALHPPVYYSHIVPRPYGYSPYAYPPYVMTPEAPPSAPQVMHNPHAPSPTRSQKSDNRVAHVEARTVEPKTIVNPYADSSVADSLPAPVRRGRPAPKTVHPSAMANVAGKLAR